MKIKDPARLAIHAAFIVALVAAWEIAARSNLLDPTFFGRPRALPTI